MCRCMLINYNTILHVFASERVFSPLADQLVSNVANSQVWLVELQIN